MRVSLQLVFFSYFILPQLTEFMSSSDDSFAGIIAVLGGAIIAIIILLYIIYVASVIMASAGAVAGAIVSLKNFFLSLWRVYKARLAAL